MKTKRISILMILMVLGSLLLAACSTDFQAGQTEQAAATQPEAKYRLNLSRTFGYSAGSQVQGSFRAEIYGLANDVQSVEYFIDSQSMADAVTESPYALNFTTDMFPEGWHDLYAVVTETDGTQVETATRRLEFVSAGQAGKATLGILVPILGVVLLFTVVGVGSQVLATRKKGKVPLGAERTYGMMGGTICPRCGRPYARHIWAFNMVAGKLDRCDHCGKWAIVRALPLDVLRAAEKAELAAAGEINPIKVESEDDKLRDMLDDSKYSK